MNILSFIELLAMYRKNSIRFSIQTERTRQEYHRLDNIEKCIKVFKYLGGKM